MDPNTCLNAIRELLSEEDESMWLEVKEYFQALDSWMSTGGFLPDDWQRPDTKGIAAP